MWKNTHPNRLLTQLPVVVVAAAGAAAFGQCPETKLTAGDAHCPQFLGYSVAVDGDVLVAGAPGDWPLISNSDPGGAYVFRRGTLGWSQAQKLVASDGDLGDFFGSAVGVLGDTILVGAQYHVHPGSARGAVYAFRWNGTQWVEEQELSFPNYQLGATVSLSGNRAALGSPGDEFGPDDLGAVHVFRRVGGTWTLEQTVTASDPQTFDKFGWAVSLDGTVLAVGASSHAPAGAAYVLRWNGSSWTEEQKLTLTGPNEPEDFGASVAVRGDVLVVGATDTGPNNTGGTVLVYRRNTASWGLEQRIAPGDAHPSDWFGSTMALGPTCLLVGAIWADTPTGADSGAAYLFSRTGTRWTAGPRFVPSDGGTDISTVFSVALSGTTPVMGTGWDDDACPGNPDPFGGRSGAAYVYDTQGCFACIPTLSGALVFLLAVLLLAAGGVLLRRRPSHARGGDDTVAPRFSVSIVGTRLCGSSR